MLPLLRLRSAKFVEWQWISYFYCPSNTKIANTPLDRSAALVLSLIN